MSLSSQQQEELVNYLTSPDSTPQPKFDPKTGTHNFVKWSSKIKSIPFVRDVAEVIEEIPGVKAVEGLIEDVDKLLNKDLNDPNSEHSDIGHDPWSNRTGGGHSVDVGVPNFQSNSGATSSSASNGSGAVNYTGANVNVA